MHYGFHDGRSLLAEGEVDLTPEDSCLIQVPSQKVVKCLKMEEDALVMVIRGEKAGDIGKVKEFKPGTFTRPPVATISFDKGTAELAVDLLLAVGREEPVIQVT